MKYTILRQFSFTHKKFEISAYGKVVSMVKVTSSKQQAGQYNLIFYDVHHEYQKQGRYFVIPDDKQPCNYLIYAEDRTTNERILFGQVSYSNQNPNNYIYSIILAGKMYQVSSSDLKDRRLTIVDTVPSDDASKTFYLRNLLQVADTFSRSSKAYHVTVEGANYDFGCLAIVILLSLHESKRIH